MLLAHRPAPPLGRYVEKLWYCEGYQVAHRQERVLPNGRFQLIIDLADYADADSTPAGIIVGIRSQYSVTDTAGLQSIIGVVFWPGGSRRFFDVPADEFYNAHVPLELLWGSNVREVRERLRDAETADSKFRVLEDALVRRAQERLELHAAVQYALGEFLQAPHIRSIVDVTRDAGLSRRRFTQLFREQVGITPKLYCRLGRFQRVLKQIAAGGPVDWVDVALSGGYSDQPHMAHEFREFPGMSPGAYLAGERPFINHVRMD